jgi:hypothetical protein
MTRLRLAILIVGIVAPSVSLAVPIQWTVGAGGNDHWYDAIVKPEGLPLTRILPIRLAQQCDRF